MNKTKKHTSNPLKINYSLLTGVSVGIIILVLFGPFLFGSSLFLFTDIGSDTVNIFWPTYIEGARHWMEYGMPGYSFEQGLGMDTFSDHIFRPFQILIEWAGRENIPMAIAYIEVLKFGLIAFILHSYARLNEYDPKISVLFVLLGTFTGFVVLGSSWYLFSTRALQFYLLILGLDYVLKRNKISLFALAVFLIASFQPFYLYFFGVFGILYAFTKYPELLGQFSNRISSFGRLIAGSVLGLLLSVPFLWSKLKQVTEGPRLSEASLSDKVIENSSGLDLEGHFSSLLLRLFGNNTLGVGDDYTGWNNYLEGPLVYMGSLALVVALYYVVSRFKENKLPAVIALISLLVLALPILRNAVWLFLGDYQRELGLVIGFVILLGFVKGWQQIFENGIRSKDLVVVLALLLLLMLIGYSTTSGNVANDKLWLYGFFIASQLGLLYLLQKNRSTAVYLALIGAVVLELIVLHYPTLHMRDVIAKRDISKRIYYNDLMHEAVAALPDMSSDFYRVHKLYPSGPSPKIGLNDSKVFGYYGSMGYHSFNANSCIRFFELFDIVDYSDENTTRWTTGFIDHPLLMNLVANRYVVVKKGQPLPPFLKATYTLFKDFGSIEVYQNPNPLSVAQVLTNRLNEQAVRQLDVNNRIRALYNGVILDSASNATSELPYFDLNSLSPNYSVSEHNAEVAALQGNSTTEIYSFEPERITGKITVNQAGALVFSIPFDPYWQLTLNGENIDLETLNTGLIGLSYIQKGEYNFELTYQAEYLSTGKYFLFAGLLFFVFVVFLEEKSKLFKNK